MLYSWHAHAHARAHTHTHTHKDNTFSFWSGNKSLRILFAALGTFKDKVTHFRNHLCVRVCMCACACVRAQPQLRATYLLHAVVHRQKRLQALPLQHVGELHVDGPHGARVPHDPVLVCVRSVVVTGSSGEKRVDQRMDEREELWLRWFYFHVHQIFHLVQQIKLFFRSCDQ